MPEGSIQNYEYDDLDNISKLAEIQGNKIEETSYSYDKNSRLLLQETENGSEVKQNRFSYDLNGNQLTKDEVIKRNGNTVSSKATQYWYDGYNQLQRVQDANGMYTEYTYNGSGLRTKKESGNKATNYIYDGGANIIMETDKENKVSAKNIRGLKLIYRESYANSITDPTYLYYLHNAHGDVTQLLNESGEVIKDYRYDPFGEEQSVESLAFGGKQASELWRQEIEAIDNPFRYAGEYQDSETGNYYLRARYYDPTTQRFINEDSYGVEKGASWLEHIYGYGNNNPITFVDPTGHFSDSQTYGLYSATKALVKSLTTKVGSTWLKTTKNKKGKVMVDAKQAANAYGFSVQNLKNGNYAVWKPNGQRFEYSARQHGLYDLQRQWGILGTGKTKNNGVLTEAQKKEIQQKAVDMVIGSVGGGSGNYKAVFFAKNSLLEGQVVVHHAIEQQVLKRFPGLFSEKEIHAYENLRGIPNEINNSVHLSAIRKEWNNFYKSIDKGIVEPTKEAFQNKAKEIDDTFGSLFKPEK